MTKNPDKLISEDTLKGGEFLIKDSTPEDIFIPEEFGEEEEMIKDTCKDFLQNRIFPNVEKIEKQEDNISKKPRIKNYIC